MPKLYNVNGNSPPCRPVVAGVGSLFHCMSRWSDMCFRQLLDQTLSHVKNLADTALTLYYMEEPDDNTLFFKADTAVMCQNMSTEEGLMFLTIEIDNFILRVD